MFRADVILILLGSIAMVCALVFCFRLISTIKDKDIQKPWYLLLFLICFFIVGYVGTLYFLLNSSSDFGALGVLLGAILFFGAVFVILVLLVNYNLNTKMNIFVSELEKKGGLLSKTAAELNVKTQELEEKNKELSSTLEDFYTLRISAEQDIKAGKFKEENKRVRERIDELKRE